MASFTLDNYAKNLILDTLKKGRLSPGPITAEFESKFAKMHGAKYAIFTNSGTSALQIALHALKSIHKWKDGDEVLVPSITFIATSNVVLLNRMKPVFVDVNPYTYNIDPKQIEQHITKRTRAIIPVHLFGLPAKMDEINKIAKKHNLKVIEDSCEAMAVNYKNQSVGSLGDIGCFSTYIAHLLITGVGGIATTNNSEYAVKLKSLMNHGRDSIYLNIDDDKEKKGKQLFNIIQKRFSFVDVGYSYRATELEAALGLSGLRNLKSFVQKRQKNAAHLTSKLKRFSPFIRLPTIPKDKEHAFMMYPITVIDPRLSRDELTYFFEERGVETRHAMPLLNQPIYKKLFGDLESRYPNAAYINQNSFYFGYHHDLTRQELDYIVKAFRDYFKSKKVI